MPDLLSHALIAYTLCTLLALRYRWLSPAYVTIGMAGAFIPDIAKISLALDSAIIGALIDKPFNWFAIHTLGGAAIAVLIGVLLVAAEERRRVLALLSLGAGSHLFADALLYNVTGHSYPVFWPLTMYRPPSPGIYHSTDIWPSIALAGIAVLTWYVVRKRPTTE